MSSFQKPKIKYPLVFLTIVAIIAGSVYWVFFRPEEALAEWFNDNWYYRAPITITNYSGSNQTDFQVFVPVDTSNITEFQNDCDDIRFTDIGGNLLNYWIEYGCSTTSTKIWVKVSSIPSAGTTIYMYYGNPSASSYQDGEKTFEFFDDFSTADTSKFTYGESYSGYNPMFYEVSGGLLREWSDGTWRTLRMKKDFVPSEDVAIHTRFKTSGQSSWHHSYLVQSGDIDRNRWGIQDQNLATRDFRPQARCDGGEWWYGSTMATLSTDTWYRDFIKKVNSYGHSAFIYNDDGSQAGSGYSLMEMPGWLDETWTWVNLQDQNVNVYFDWIFVTKAISDWLCQYPKGCSPGTKEKGPAPVAYWRFDEGYGDTTYDDSSNNNDGTIVGATWQTEDLCVSGKCVGLNGTSDYAYSNNNVLFLDDEMTWEIWAKPVSLTGLGSNPDWQTLLTTYAYNGGNQQGLRLDFNYYGSYKVTVLGVGDVTYSSSNISLNEWHHFAFSYSKSSQQTKLYLDGKEVNSGSNGGASITWPANKKIGMGSRLDHLGYANFRGFIDEVKIYPYARSAAQIKADYLGGSVAGSSAKIGPELAWLSEGLVGYWKMDESSWGTVIDSSGNGNNGTAYNGAAPGAGKFGNGGIFDGAGDYVSVSHSTSINVGNTFTVSAWAKPTALSGNQEIAIKWASGNYWFLRWLNTTLQFSPSSDETNARVDYVGGTAGVWQHVLGTYDGSVGRLYLNGELVASKSYSGGTNQNSGSLGIGAIADSPSQYFGGTLDEVRIYNRALSPREIRHLYEWAPVPVGYWKMDEASWNGTSGEVKDSSTYGNNGTAADNATTYSPGKYGKAGVFDNSGDYIQLPANNSLKNPRFTVATWIKGRSWDASRDDFVSWAQRGFHIAVVDGGTLRWWNYLGGSWRNIDDPTGSLSLDTWYHVAGTWDGDYMRLYKNGVLVTSTNAYSGQSSPDYSQGRPQIGAYSNTGGYGANSPVDGYIDDVRIYNYARTQKQIIEDMNAGHPAVGSPIGSYVGYWNFDEGYGDTAYDMSIHNNNGTITGASWTNDGKFGKALSFDGAGDYVTVSPNPFNASQTQGTITFWGKLNTFSTDSSFIYRVFGHSLYPRVFYVQSTDYVRFQWKIDTITKNIDITNFSNNYSANTWYHFALVLDTSFGGKAYINGKQVGTQSTTGTSFDGGTNSMLIGYDTNLSFYLNGNIDEVKIYPFALTKDEVWLEYNRGATVLLGAVSTDSSGNASWSSERGYCPPGDTTASCGPVAEWKMDKKSGTKAYDTSGNGYTGTLINQPTWAPGKYGSALSFDGSDEHVSINDNDVFDVLTNVSFTAWIKTTNACTQAILSHYDWESSKRHGWDLEMTEQLRVYFYNYSDESNAIGSTSINDGNWHFVAATWDGGTPVLYIDGSVDTLSSSADAINATSDSNDTIRIGQRSWSGVWQFNGKIDHVLIYDYARTPAQIAWDYNRGKPVAHWRFDEGQATTTYDDSDNNNDGEMKNMDSATDWVEGKYNTALDFDGSNDYVSVPTIDLANKPFSVSAWVKPSSTDPPSSQTYFGAHTASAVDQSIHLRVYDTGQIRFGFYSDDLNTTTGVATLGEWNHIVVTYDYDTDTSKIYVNAAEKASGANGPFIGTLPAIKIGTWTTSSEPFKGKIDDARIYNYALTPEQIKMDYNQGAAVRFGPATGIP